MTSELIKHLKQVLPLSDTELEEFISKFELFSLDFEFITDYFSFLTSSPAEKNVKCIEHTELLVLPFEVLIMKL